VTRCPEDPAAAGQCVEVCRLPDMGYQFFFMMITDLVVRGAGRGATHDRPRPPAMATLFGRPLSTAPVGCSQRLPAALCRSVQCRACHAKRILAPAPSPLWGLRV
jgi:hypothetical protein